jgi:carboxypeptidase C (cathepsin A)
MKDGFKKGSGCFPCILCGKLTRQRDSNSELCRKCEEEGEELNYMADHKGQHSSDFLAKQKKEYCSCSVSLSNPCALCGKEVCFGDVRVTKCNKGETK